MKRRTASATAAALLGLMTALTFASAWDDTPTSDDNVALVSGYSYLRKQEYRLEAQNPPLIKDLAALPLLFMDIHEPWDHRGWTEEEDPDVLGRVLLYHSGNDPDAIMRAARAPMILFAVAFGGVLFWWTRKEFGSGVALLTLFLYALSPTFLAHGRFVATDLGATAGFFLGVTCFLRFLKTSTNANIARAGLAMGLAFLTKFSTVALIPIALILAVAWPLVSEQAGRRVRGLLRCLARTAGIIAIAYLVIYPVYLHHVWNYAPERQAQSVEFHRHLYSLSGPAFDAVRWASDKAIVWPWAEYFLGLLVALKASEWGQPVFFLGEVHPTGSRWYFPFVYLVKEPLALHLLTVVALVFALSRFPWRFQDAGLREWLAEHFTEFAFLVVLGIYWTALIRSNMNIGVRHLLPGFPFTFVLVASQIVTLFRKIEKSGVGKWGVGAALGALLAWQAVAVLRVHPSYLAYFNELVGGPEGGWRYVNDSNLDWGQDVKRLAQFVDERDIPGIYASFFGPADAPYYLKDRYLGPVPCFDSEPPEGWLAVSAMVYPGAPWNPECDYRRWLPMDNLVTKIGYSIFVFHVE